MNTNFHTLLPHYDQAYSDEYLFVPCDGTVVTGEGDIGCADIGCAGHKNREGQRKVKDFVKPVIGRMLEGE